MPINLSSKTSKTRFARFIFSNFSFTNLNISSKNVAYKSSTLWAFKYSSVQRSCNINLFVYELITFVETTLPESLTLKRNFKKWVLDLESIISFQKRMKFSVGITYFDCLKYSLRSSNYYSRSSFEESFVKMILFWIISWQSAFIEFTSRIFSLRILIKRMTWSLEWTFFSIELK